MLIHGTSSVLRGLVIALAIGFALSAPAAMSGCSGGNDGGGPSAPASQCNTASFDNSAGIGFSMGCTSINVSISGITFDGFSRRTSYNYDIACSNGSNRKSGRVYNITYNNLGQALTWDFTVNGTQCRKS